MRREYRKLILVPLVDGEAVIEFDPETQWIDSVSEFNDQFLRVILAGIAGDSNA